MTQPRRLDQLLFLDETRLGLILVSTVLVAFSVLSVDLGRGYLVRLGLARESTGVVQAAVLFALSVALATGRNLHLRKRLELRPVEEVDIRLAEELDYLGNAICRRKIDVYLTPRIDDANAFCVPGMPQPYVVAGGGLRLLLRKSRPEAMGVLAHECFHLHRGDALLLVFTWHIFLAFGLLSAVSGLALQVEYWIAVSRLNWAAAIGGDQLLLSIKATLVASLNYGWPALILWLVSGWILLHVIRLREFIADESAAQRGWRDGLIARFRAATPLLRKGIYSRFHPTPAERSQRLQRVVGWDRVEGMLCVTSTMLAYILIRSAASILDTNISKADFFAKIEQAVNSEGWYVVALVAATILAISYVSIFLLSHHVYRVVMTRHSLALGSVDQLLKALLASCAGAVLGIIVWPGFLAGLLQIQNTQGFGELIDESLTDFLGLFQAIIASVIVAALMAVSVSKLRPSSGRLLKFLFIVAWTVILVLMNELTFIASHLAHNADLLRWAERLPSLPTLSDGLARETTSLLGVAATCAALYLTFLLVFGLIEKSTFRAALMRVDPRRFAIDRLAVTSVEDANRRARERGGAPLQPWRMSGLSSSPLVWIGASVLATSALFGQAAHCPTALQHQLIVTTFAISVGLMASPIASHMMHPDASSRRRALVGHLAGLLVVAGVLATQPNPWRAVPPPESFSNASCQRIKASAGPVPKSSIEAQFLPELAGNIDSDISEGRPVQFRFDYPYGEMKGLRIWTQVRRGVWTETYPDPSLISIFTEQGRTIHRGCAGSMVARGDEAMTVFIPDRPCKERWIFWQGAKPGWNMLGVMLDER